MNVVYEGDFFLDSNIWLYALSHEVGNPTAEAKRISAIELTQRSGIVISFQVINEVCINAIKKLKFTQSEILELIQDFYAGCIVIESSQDLSVQAARLRSQYQLSFWDSLIVAAAIQSGVSVLYSEDMQSGLNVNNQLKIINPFL
jgi:predicted nucleic acid-binding protein